MRPLDSRHIVNMPWRQDAPPAKQIVLVKGTTGMMAPRDEFIALGIFDMEYHPKADDHWFDMNNDHFTDQGWLVTYWCEL